MKPPLILLLMFVGLLARVTLAEPQRVDLAVTAYNADRAVIYDVRRFPLQEGVNQVALAGVAARLDPTSVQIRCGSAGFDVIEQNFDYDLAGDAQLLYRYLGCKVTLNLTDGGVASGTLLTGPERVRTMEFARQGRTEVVRFDLRGISLGEDGGGVRIFPVTAVKDFSLVPPEGGVLSRPTLNWLIRSAGKGERDCEIAYMTGGMSWRADYTVQLPRDPAGRIQAGLIGVVTVRNDTGASYPDARLKLVAGDVQVITEEEPRDSSARARGEIVMAEKAMPAFQERNMFEYHLYDLQRRATLLDKEIKQIEFIRADAIPLDRFFVYDGALLPRYGVADRSYGTACDKSVWTYLETKNSKENHLGKPLPKGKLRLREVSEQGESFIGEAQIDHTPRDEKLLLRVGRAFDLTGERIQTDFKTPSDRVIEESFTVTVRSVRAAPANVRVVEHLYRGAQWEILRTDADWQKSDSATIEFRFALEPGKEKKIAYTVRYTGVE